METNTFNEQEFYVEVGKRLKIHREKAGMKQKELAQNIGVKPPFISAVENQGEKISLYLLKKAAKALGITIDELLTEKKTAFTASLTTCLS